jgi:large subunit ribosomal protein L19
MKQIAAIEAEVLKKELPAFRPGDTVRVHQLIQEGDKERIQVYEGVVIKLHRAGAKTTFTVRKISYGIGVEKIFPLYSPLLEKIEIKQQGKVRRSRLYYMRSLRGKAARIKEKRPD